MLGAGFTSVEAANSSWNRIIIQVSTFLGGGAIIRVGVMIRSTLRQKVNSSKKKKKGKQQSDDDAAYVLRAVPN